jgi:hypothetical protein
MLGALEAFRTFFSTPVAELTKAKEEARLPQPPQ